MPKWVTDTPDDCSYDLTMFNEWGGEIQGVRLTRDDYIGLKEHLANMRGIVSHT